jgi:CelD/BcsL family acetyltransferase involved in cellulose biosynthesis
MTVRRSVRVATGGRLAFDVLSGESALELVADGWRDLAERCGPATIFQTWEWHQAWWESIGRARGDSEPVIVRLSSVGRLVGLVPLMRVTVDGRTALRFMTSPVADYHDGIAEDGPPAQAAAVIAAALEDGRAAADGIELDELRPQALLRAAVARLRDRLVLAVEPSSRCPYLTLGPEPLAQQGQYRRKERRLAIDTGGLEVEHLVDRDGIQRCLDDFFRMHTEQWSERPDVAGSFDEAHNARFFEALVDRLAPRGWLLFSRLRAGGRVVAQDFSFQRCGVLSTYRSAIARDMARYSPGHLLLARLFEHARASGVGEVDMLRGEYPYKFVYAEGERENIRLRTLGSTIPLARSDGIVAASSLRPLPRRQS